MTNGSDDQDYVDDVYADDEAYDAEMIDSDIDEMAESDWSGEDPQESMTKNDKGMQSKKKSGLFSPFNIAVVAIGVLVGGVFIWNSFSSGANKASPEAAQIDQIAQQQTDPQLANSGVVPSAEIEAEYPAPVSPSMPSDAPQVAMPEAMPEQAIPTDLPAPETPSSVEGGFVGDASKLVKAGENPSGQKPDMVPLPPPEADQVADQPVLMTQSEATTSVAPAEPAASEQTAQPAAVVPAPVPELPQPEIEAQEPVVEVPQAQASTPVVEPVAPTAERGIDQQKQQSDNTTALMNDMRAEIDRLKLELEAMKAEKNQAVSALAEQKNHIVDLAPTVQEQPSIPKVRASVPKAQQNIRKAVAKKATNSWELRSAKSGSAMIARKGDSEMQVIKIGDSVSGLGRITNISDESGRWIVQGTSGRLMQ